MLRRNAKLLIVVVVLAGGFRLGHTAVLAGKTASPALVAVGDGWSWDD